MKNELFSMITEVILTNCATLSRSQFEYTGRYLKIKTNVLITSEIREIVRCCDVYKVSYIIEPIVNNQLVFKIYE